MSGIVLSEPRKSFGDVREPAIGGHCWSRPGWIVIVAWTVVAARLARIAYRRDTKRV